MLFILLPHPPLPRGPFHPFSILNKRHVRVQRLLGHSCDGHLRGMQVLAGFTRNSSRPGTPVPGENRKVSPLGKQKLVPLLQRSVDQTQPRVWIATVGAAADADGPAASSPAAPGCRNSAVGDDAAAAPADAGAASAAPWSSRSCRTCRRHCHNCRRQQPDWAQPEQPRQPATADASNSRRNTAAERHLRATGWAGGYLRAHGNDADGSDGPHWGPRSARAGRRSASRYHASDGRTTVSTRAASTSTTSSTRSTRRRDSRGNSRVRRLARGGQRRPGISCILD